MESALGKWERRTGPSDREWKLVGPVGCRRWQRPKVTGSQEVRWNRKRGDQRTGCWEGGWVRSSLFKVPPCTGSLDTWDACGLQTLRPTASDATLHQVTQGRTNCEGEPASVGA